MPENNVWLLRQRAGHAALAGLLEIRGKSSDSEAPFAALCGVSPVERSSGRRQCRRLNRGAPHTTGLVVFGQLADGSAELLADADRVALEAAP